MPTTLLQIQEFLDEFELLYRVDEDREAILLGFNLEAQETTYRDRDGDAHVGLVIRVLEDGDFLSVFVPWGWGVRGCPHKAAVFEALATIQARHKMLRFDYDPADGEIRPNVEVAIETSELTSRQFHRTIHAIMSGIERYDGVIRQAMETGVVSFASVKDHDEAGPAPEIVRMQELAAEVGGIEVLERIAGGCGAGDGSEERPATAAMQPPRPAEETPPAAVPPPPKPAIRRIWEHFFGPDEPGAGTGRRAG